MQSGDDKEFAGRVMEANRQALRYVMRRYMEQGS
jgi:hypothetical protein